MSNRNQLILRNAAFLGPAGAAGAAGTPGATGAQGVVVLKAAIVDSTALANTTALTAFDSNFPIPANTLTAGKVITVKWSGEYTIGAAQLVALQFNFQGQVILSPSFTMNTATGTFQFTAEATIVCRTTGVGGTCLVDWKITIGNTTQNIGVSYASEALLNINTTGANQVELQITFTVANNASLTRNFIVQAQN